jgi:RNA polymerase sigma factor (TIGR02999 family)
VVSESAEKPERAEAGERLSSDQLLDLVYDELRKLAAQKMGREAPGQTLQATALVHEAWLRLGGDHQPAWENRAHFFAAAAEAMRRILIDKARRRNALSRGGSPEKVPLDTVDIPAEMEDEQILALHEALDRLAKHDPPKAELVKLKFFVGLSLEEAAEVLGLSVPTVRRHWAYARAWLYRDITSSHHRP